MGRTCRWSPTDSSHASTGMDNVMRPKSSRQATSQRLMHETAFPELPAISFARREKLRVVFHAPNKRVGIPEVLHFGASASQISPVPYSNSGSAWRRRVPLAQPRKPA